MPSTTNWTHTQIVISIKFGMSDNGSNSLLLALPTPTGIQQRSIASNPIFKFIKIKKVIRICRLLGSYCRIKRYLLTVAAN